MEVQFTPNVQAKLDQMAKAAGRGSDELVQDAVMGLLDELSDAQQMLERRYHDLETGRVQLIDGDEAYRRLKAKTAGQRQQPA